jgi:hypothetical protein
MARTAFAQDRRTDLPAATLAKAVHHASVTREGCVTGLSLRGRERIVLYGASMPVSRRRNEMRPFTRAQIDARYRYLETLSPDGLVWELQRRSDAYRADYAATAEAEQDPSPEAPPALAERWRLRCPPRP